MKRWRQILSLNQDKLERFFGESRNKRSILTDNAGPFFISNVLNEELQSEIEVRTTSYINYYRMVTILSFFNFEVNFTTKLKRHYLHGRLPSFSELPANKKLDL